MIGSALLLISVWIRAGAQFLPIEKRQIFWVTFVGQVLSGGCQAFLGIGNISLMVNNWFGENERTSASTIAMLAGLVAPGAVFGLGPVIVKRASNFPYLLLGQAGLSTISSVICFMFYKSNPPTPPSSTSGENIATMKNFGQNVYTCLTNGHFSLLLLAYSIGFACFQSILILLNQISFSEGYSTVSFVQRYRINYLLNIS